MQACPVKLWQVPSPYPSATHALTLTVSSVVTHHLAIFWTLVEFQHVAGGPCLLSFVDEKPTWNPHATFAKLFIAFFFFTPPPQNDFSFTWNFFFFLTWKLWFFTPLRCFSSWCSQQGREISSQPCFMDSAVWRSDQTIFENPVFLSCPYPSTHTH